MSDAALVAARVIDHVLFSWTQRLPRAKGRVSTVRVFEKNSNVDMAQDRGDSGFVVVISPEDPSGPVLLWEQAKTG